MSLGLDEQLRRIVGEEVRKAFKELAPSVNAGIFEDTKKTAERTGLSEGALVLWRQKGGGPPFCKIHRRVVYRVSEVDAWMMEHSVG